MVSLVSLLYSLYSSCLLSFRGKANHLLSRDRNKLHARVYQFTLLDVNIFGITTLYMMLFLLCSILSLAFSGYFYPICLLYIISNNDILIRVLKAVTKNGMKYIVIITP